MKKLALVILFVFAATSAFAQGWNENNIGVYFTPDPIDNLLETAAVNDIVPCYLVGSGLTAASTNGFEVLLRVEGAGVMLPTSIIYPTDAANLATRPNEFVVGYGNPVPIVNGNFVFMEFSVLVTGTSPTCMYIEPTYFPSIPGKTAYLDGEDLNIIHALSNSTGDPVNPGVLTAVASINGLCEGGVDTEESSWGSVKSLYR